MKKATKAKEITQKGKETRQSNELKTDYPLSEKDQVKQAEEKMRPKK